MMGNVYNFNSKGSVSEMMSHATIVFGKQISDYNTKIIYFGSYALVYIGLANSMKIISVTDIASRYSNQYGGHYFMPLNSGKCIHGHHRE